MASSSQSSFPWKSLTARIVNLMAHTQQPNNTTTQHPNNPTTQQPNNPSFQPFFPTLPYRPNYPHYRRQRLNNHWLVLLLGISATLAASIAAASSSSAREWNKLTPQQKKSGCRLDLVAP